MVQQWLENLRDLTTLQAQIDATYWAKVAAIATIASITVSAFALLGLLLSLQQTAESLAESRRTGILERRPWLIVKDIEIVRSVQNNRPDVSVIASEVKITVENTGLSPALDANVVCSFTVDENGTDALLAEVEKIYARGSAVYPASATAVEIRPAVMRLEEAVGDVPLMIEVSIAYSGSEMNERLKTVALATLLHGDGKSTFFASHLPNYYDEIELEPLIHLQLM